MHLKGKTVIITGSGSGIGRAAAFHFARAGANVAVNSLSDSAALTAREIIKENGHALFLRGDVSDAETAKKIISDTVECFGSLDVLVNNVGVTLGGSVETMKLDDLDKMWKVNVVSVVLMSRYAIPYMRKQGGGIIINNGSVAGIKGLCDRSGYSATKGAVIALTRAMAADHLKDNIHVIALNPGTILTPTLQERIDKAENPNQKLAEFVGRHPLGRLGNPDEIAEWMVFLAGKGVTFSTGVSYCVDGGMSM